MLLLIGFAFLAGIVTVLSPCILPVLPIVLSGSFTGGKKRPLGIILGFILSFTFFTLFSFALVRTFGISSEVLRTIAIIVLAVFGISLFVPQIKTWLQKITSTVAQGSSSQKREGFGGGLAIGLSLGLFWTPCVGPILAGVITLAVTSAVTFEAFLITLAYAIGTAIPMFIITYGGRQLLHKFPGVLKHTDTIQKTFGVIMVLLALGLYLNLDRVFQTWILTTFPQYGVGLTQFEENETVQKELDRIYDNSVGNVPPGQDMGTVKSSMMNTNSFLSSAYPAAPNPDFAGATKWLNSNPLTLEKLKGKVVLVDFWTYTCINCIRTFPYLTSWHEKYSDDGLVIIGVHSPEFEFEKKTENVEKAMRDYKINYPVVQDNDFAIWQSYRNRYWPAEYFIDKNGKVRRTHFGEGEYDESEKFIQQLLSENGPEVKDELTESSSLPPEYRVTPESYLGYGRMDRFDSPEQIKPNAVSTYTVPQEIALHHLAYDGSWTLGEERAMPETDASLWLQFEAKEVYLVMLSGNEESRVKVYLDGKLIPSEYMGEDVQDGIVTVAEDRLYKLVKLPKPEKHLLRLEFLDEGTEVYAFTFG